MKGRGKIIKTTQELACCCFQWKARGRESYALGRDEPGVREDDEIDVAGSIFVGGIKQKLEVLRW
jgi:hypothetical protein